MAEENLPRRARRPSLVWPVLLIGAGIILLLANLNLLPANSWILLSRLWPVALIVIGLDIMVGRRSTAGSLIAGLVTMLLLIGLIGLLLISPNIPALNRLTGPGELRSTQLDTPLNQAESMRVRLDWSGSENSLRAADPNSPNLIEGVVEYYGNLMFQVNANNRNGSISLSERSSPGGFGVFQRMGTQWDVALHPDMVYDLVMDMGSGQNDFDLRGLQLSRLEMDSGSGRMDVTLPEGSYTVILDSGSGAVTLTLPRGTEARVVLDSGSGQLNAGAPLEPAGRRDEWETPGYAQAEQRITLDIDQGSGAVRIEFR